MHTITTPGANNSENLADLPPIEGFVKPGFEPVLEAFQQNFIHHEEVGASLCVILHGEPIVDLWAGYCDPHKQQRWSADTVTTVFSSSKGVVATAAHILVSRNELDLDKPVSYYWPEFAVEGKQDIPVRLLLSHRSGLIAPSLPLDDEQCLSWDEVTSALARSTPWWNPNARMGYHALTFGYLVGEVIRRITGMTVGKFIAQEIAGPLNAQFRLGVPLEEQYNCAPVFRLTPSVDNLPPVPPGGFSSIDDCSGKAAATMAMQYIPVMKLIASDLPLFRSLEIPAANGQTNARGLATIYDALCAGSLFSESIFARARSQQNKPMETDLVLEPLGFSHPRWSLGYMLGVIGLDIPAVGHGGLGGSFGFADPSIGLGYGYVMNHLRGGTSGEDQRNVILIKALYRALANLGKLPR